MQDRSAAIFDTVVTVEGPRVLTVQRDQVRVRYVEVADDGELIPEAWSQLEAAVGPLRGRRFLATIADGRYRASVEVADVCGVGEAALNEAVVPGGRYLRARLRGDPPEVYQRIPATWESVAAAGDIDPSRPSLELYRRRDEIDVLAPVL